MRILIISKEAWRDEQNGGNVLSNIFRDFDAEFAQIYCNEQQPNNNICSSYYQITDKEMVKSLFSSKKAGRYLLTNGIKDDSIPTQQTYIGLRKWLKSTLPIFREIAWSLGHWNTVELEQFITDFNPDIIFAPCYGSHYMHRLTFFAQKTAKVNVISYISDDHYSNKQIRWQPWFWINHFFLRQHTRKVFKLYSLVYTMTDEQKAQCEKDFHANMKILRKAGEFRNPKTKSTLERPIRFIYAGGLYLNRWKTLALLVKAMREIDPVGKLFRLDIYSNNTLCGSAQQILDNHINSELHAAISAEQLRAVYLQSDIALHCESFDLVNRYKVRMSFSTKIVDCLDSGCAVMAICDPKQAGWAYLQRNDAAICLSSFAEIKAALQQISSTPEIIDLYQQKAFELGRKNHLYKSITESIQKDFRSLSR